MILAVTGHRPNKLGNAYELNHPTNINIGKKMRGFILKQAGYNKEQKIFTDESVVTLISGMALGVDTIWAMVALKLKNEFPEKFQLECAIPCQNHSSRWMNESKKIYDDIISKADKVTLVSDETYKPYLMQVRNEYMVNKCDKLLAVWDGTKGGTGNCVNYAKNVKKAIYVLHPFELTLNKIVTI